jgi:hypothetical protein
MVASLCYFSIPIDCAVAVALSECGEGDNGTDKKNKNFFHKVESSLLIMSLTTMITVFATTNNFGDDQSHPENLKQPKARRSHFVKKAPPKGKGLFCQFYRYQDEIFSREK